MNVVNYVIECVASYLTWPMFALAVLVCLPFFLVWRSLRRIQRAHYAVLVALEDGPAGVLELQARIAKATLGTVLIDKDTLLDVLYSLQRQGVVGCRDMNQLAVGGLPRRVYRKLRKDSVPM